MKSLKRKSAFISTAAALAVFGSAAFTASAFESVDLDDRADELKEGVVNIVADQVYAEPGEKVDFRVMISGNTGYADSGIDLYFDSALKVEMEDEYHPLVKQGAASQGLTMERAINTKQWRLGYSTIGTKNCTNDGTDYTAYFTVPEDAKPDTVYPMKLVIVDFLDNKTKEVKYTTVDGWIKVREKAVTTTAPVTTTTTATTTTRITTSATTSTTPAPVTSTTTVTTPPVTTPKPVTTSSETQPRTDTTPAPVTTSETELVIVTTDTTEPVTEPITQKTTRDINPNKAVTTAQGGTRPAGKSVKTGDAGIGAAAAALLLAAGTAAAVRKRRKDD